MSKLLIGEQPSKAWLVELGKLNRRQLRLAMGWLTGHSRVNYHLSKMGLSQWTVDGVMSRKTQQRTSSVNALDGRNFGKRWHDLPAWRLGS